MNYKIKGFLFKDNDKNTLECRFECILPSFKDVVEFLSRVSLDAYDRVTVFPIDYKEC